MPVCICGTEYSCTCHPLEGFYTRAAENAGAATSLNTAPGVPIQIQDSIAEEGLGASSADISGGYLTLRINVEDFFVQAGGADAEKQEVLHILAAHYQNTTTQFAVQLHRHRQEVLSMAGVFVSCYSYLAPHRGVDPKICKGPLEIFP